jgi:hypothetical protein
MQNTVLGSSSLTANVLRRVFLLYGGLAIASMTFSYLGGSYPNSIWNISISWIWAASSAAIFEYSRRLSIPPRDAFFYKILFLAPALIQIGQDMARFLAYRSFSRAESVEYIFLLLAVLDISWLILCVGLLRSAYMGYINSLTTPAREFEDRAPSANDLSSITKVPLFRLLGRGDGYIDRVINSVIERSMKSERQANFSLTIMLILVMIGGMASFGLWVFTHADRISTLEAERNKLITLQEGFKDALDKLDPNDAESKARLDRLIKFIEQNYSNSESYKDSLNRLSQQSQSNYADIAIRVTIAVLTIFLVQVFFAVYKYNRHLSNMLAAKAEALELAGNDEDSRKELSREAVSIVKESVPGFGARPRTPLEEVVQAADKLRKRE